MTLVIAHRGSSERHPDNSWPAFEAALKEGADCIECDVQATRDGVLVIRHDLNVGAHPLHQLSLADIKAIEPDIVGLADLLAWAAQHSMQLLVEIKDPDAADAIADMVAGSRARSLCVLGGFHAPCLARVKRKIPQLRTSIMMGSVISVESLIVLARDYGADGVHPCWEARAPEPHRLLDRAAIERLHEAGLAVTLWHEEREDELVALAALGADGICTNVPERLRQIIGRPRRKQEAHAGIQA